METIIRLKPEEFSDAVFEKIKGLLHKDDLVEIKVYSQGSSSIYESKLTHSKQELGEGKTISFTMEEFTEYVKSAKK
ncbi:MAG: hypothetical protein K2U26_11110 [Cyclobacteriaceae bacterium]|nr:hypothetical protein [Cyclobacteriaceae bacterium]